MIADPKPRKRIKDKELLAEFHRWYSGTPCWACRKNRGMSIHHMRKHPRDDVLDNLAWLCGSGSSLCHGAVEGSPYVNADGERWDRQRVLDALHSRAKVA